MKRHSRIETTRHVNALGMVEAVEYQWIGKSPLIAISWFDLARLDHCVWVDRKMVRMVRLGPYHMRVVKKDDLSGAWECVRLDYPFWWIYPACHHALFVARKIYLERKYKIWQEITLT